VKSSHSNPGPRKAAIVFIFITVLLDVLALGVIIPVFPRLVSDLTGGDTSDAAKIYGLFLTVWALMQFFFSPLLGAISDRFGRRPVVLLSNFGLGLDYIVMALAPTLSWLFVGRIFSGITASSIPAAYAYIADVTPHKKRAAGFGMIGAAFGVGFVLGPVMGGILGEANPRLPFWIAAGLSLLNGLYGLFVLPESLAPKNRAPFEWKKANPVGSLKLLRSHPDLFGLSFVNFLGYVAHVVLPSSFVLYATHRFGWSPKSVGFSLMLVGLCSGIVQGTLIGPLVKRFKEKKALLLGIFFGVLGFTVFGLAPNGFWLLLLGVPLTALWGLYGPAIQGLMSRHVSASEQGRLQGANNSMRGISEMVGPGLFTMTFAYFIQPGAHWNLPGAPFLLAALFLAISLILAWRLD
jgi:MFS transporter, DHA1 family, tetracycline resistance protein